METEGSTCLQRCLSPADGGRRTLDQGCSAGSFACKQGYEQVDGEQRCFLKGCQEGSLQARDFHCVHRGQEVLCGQLCVQAGLVQGRTKAAPSGEFAMRSPYKPLCNDGIVWSGWHATCRQLQA